MLFKKQISGDFVCWGDGLCISMWMWLCLLWVCAWVAYESCAHICDVCVWVFCDCLQCVHVGVFCVYTFSICMRDLCICSVCVCVCVGKFCGCMCGFCICLCVNSLSTCSVRVTVIRTVHMSSACACVLYLPAMSTCVSDGVYLLGMCVYGVCRDKIRRIGLRSEGRMG